ncbi:hypothetical protein H5410_037392 [Solanum commersonii]|uniref:Uncharacterized protein n=1 Tax=Solanum commersonii TaxID=4109 RepID=A0A9J5Y9E7_SOLCO|nr:hypothetical protein H5410_037392 [Solanum commersonii]
MATTYMNHNSSKHEIDFEPFDEMYLLEFFLEPEIIKDLYLDNYFLKIKDNIQPRNMPSEEMLLINGISLRTIERDIVDSQKEGSQSCRDKLHSSTNTSTLVPIED